jgi:acyl carrier protein
MAVSMDEIKTLVGLQLGVKGVDQDDRIVETLGAESADVMNIVVAIEDKYQILIDEGDLAQVHTVADLFRLVQRLQSSLDHDDA